MGAVYGDRYLSSTVLGAGLEAAVREAEVARQGLDRPKEQLHMPPFIIIFLPHQENSAIVLQTD